jgi:hypothetical protein
VEIRFFVAPAALSCGSFDSSFGIKLFIKAQASSACRRPRSAPCSKAASRAAASNADCPRRMIFPNQRLEIDIGEKRPGSFVLTPLIRPLPTVN